MKGINEEHLQKMRIKLLISQDQWKALKAHMYWTFIIFSGLISLSLFYKTLSNPSDWTKTVENIEYSQLLNALITFSLVFILLEQPRFRSQLGMIVGIVSIIHSIGYFSCLTLTFAHHDANIQYNIDTIIKFLQDAITQIFQLILTPSETNFICSQITNNTPVGAFIYWTMFIFSSYMENNYLKVVNTLKEFDEMQELLTKVTTTKPTTSPSPPSTKNNKKRDDNKKKNKKTQNSEKENTFESRTNNNEKKRKKKSQ